jgi:hypothetical protein
MTPGNHGTALWRSSTNPSSETTAQTYELCQLSRAKAEVPCQADRSDPEFCGELVAINVNVGPPAPSAPRPANVPAFSGEGQRERATRPAAFVRCNALLASGRRNG